MRTQSVGTDWVSRAAIRLGVVALFAGILWAHLTELPKIAYASGRLEPESALRRIEHPDGGIVAELLAAEGDVLKAGDIVLRLSPDDIDAELQTFEARTIALRRSLARVHTLLNLIGDDPIVAARAGGADPVTRARLMAYETRRARLAEQLSVRQDAIKASHSRVATLDSQLQLATEDADRAETLAERGLLNRSQLYEARSDMLNVSVLAIEARETLADTLAQEGDALDALHEFHAQMLETLQKEASETEDSLTLASEALLEAQVRRARLTVTMPLDGVVQTMHLRTLGEVIDAGGLIADVLPAGEDLVAVVDLHPMDAGHIQIGQKVDLRLPTFNIKRYGTVGGTIEHISPTSYQDENGDFRYRLRITLDRQNIGGPDDIASLRPGIEVNAAILTETRSVLEYAFSPIADPLRKAFFER